MYEKFEKLLKARGVNAYKVARDLGFNNTLFSDWKSGKSKPKVDKLKKIADYFGVTIEYLITPD
jgi:transcriptional regulator with XRE-family HTH domain